LSEEGPHARWDETHLLQEMRRIVGVADKRGATLRGLGAAAIRNHSHGFGDKCQSVLRPLTDLDFITYLRQERQVMEVFRECGYVQDRARAYLRNVSGRSILEEPASHLVIDLFFNKLSYNHTIDLSTRLECDSLTIPLADLFLEKMQIVQINEKDVKDTILLLHEHSTGENDNETINMSRICDVLSKDWGFYYTVTTNLKKIAQYATALHGLSESVKTDVLSKANKIETIIESAPKSTSWKLRARVGTKKKWYDDVEELYAGH
jgi:hypothetical protein